MPGTHLRVADAGDPQRACRVRGPDRERALMVWWPGASRVERRIVLVAAAAERRPAVEAELNVSPVPHPANDGIAQSHTRAGVDGRRPPIEAIATGVQVLPCVEGGALVDRAVQPHVAECGDLKFNDEYEAIGLRPARPFPIPSPLVDTEGVLPGRTTSASSNAGSVERDRGTIVEADDDGVGVDQPSFPAAEPTLVSGILLLNPAPQNSHAQPVPASNTPLSRRRQSSGVSKSGTSSGAQERLLQSAPISIVSSPVKAPIRRPTSGLTVPMTRWTKPSPASLPSLASGGSRVCRAAAANVRGWGVSIARGIRRRRCGSDRARPRRVSIVGGCRRWDVIDPQRARSHPLRPSAAARDCRLGVDPPARRWPPGQLAPPAQPLPREDAAFPSCRCRERAEVCLCRARLAHGGRVRSVTRADPA